MPSLAATAFAVARVVAREHHDAQPFGVEGLESRQPYRLDRIHDAEEPHDLSRAREEHHRVTVATQSFGITPGRFEKGRGVAHHRRIAERELIPADHALDPLPRDGAEAGDRLKFEIPLSCGGGERCASGCSLDCSSDAAARSAASSASPLSPFSTASTGRPSVRVAGLVDDQRVDALQALESLGPPDQDTRRGASSRAHHDCHWCRQPSAQGHAMIRHGDAGNEGMGEPGFGTNSHPRP
jgi:hypothetical protein